MRKFLYFICISIFISLIFNILTTIELYKTKVEFKSFKKHLLENGLKNYKITGNKEFAQKSHQQAKILLDKREFSSSRIHCLNAINNVWNQPEYYTTLMSAVMNDKTISIADLMWVKDVLEYGIYHVPNTEIAVMKERMMFLEKIIQEYKEQKENITIHEHYQKGMDFFQKNNWGKATYHFMQAATREHQGALKMLKRYDNVLKYNIPND